MVLLEHMQHLEFLFVIYRIYQTNVLISVIKITPEEKKFFWEHNWCFSVCDDTSHHHVEHFLIHHSYILKHQQWVGRKFKGTSGEKHIFFVEIRIKRTKFDISYSSFPQTQWHDVKIKHVSWYFALVLFLRQVFNLTKWSRNSGPHRGCPLCLVGNPVLAALLHWVTCS